MRIYLAARYSRHPELQGYAAELEAMGHEITSRWIRGGHPITDEGLSKEAEEGQRRRFAVEDLEDLAACDLCISFSEPPRGSNSRGGRHVEHGLALGMGKLTMVVGPRENVFHCLPGTVVCATWAEAAPRLAAAMSPAVWDGWRAEALAEWKFVHWEPLTGQNALVDARNMLLEAGYLLIGCRPNTPEIASRVDALLSRLKDAPWVLEKGREEEEPGEAPGPPCPKCGERQEVWNGTPFCPDCGEDPP